MKTELTLSLERQIQSATLKQGVFGCLEVTIGWFGKERVDYITYDTKDIWRCYEIKVSKSDFNSKAHNTFIGHYNYYVMPIELYEEVKDKIPKHIGVYSPLRSMDDIKKYKGDKYEGNFFASIKKAKKQKLGANGQVMKNSLIRSLCREVSKKDKEIDELNKQLSKRRNRK